MTDLEENANDHSILFLPNKKTLENPDLLSVLNTDIIESP